MWLSILSTILTVTWTRISYNQIFLTVYLISIKTSSRYFWHLLCIFLSIVRIWHSNTFESITGNYSQWYFFTGLASQRWLPLWFTVQSRFRVTNGQTRSLKCRSQTAHCNGFFKSSYEFWFIKCNTPHTTNWLIYDWYYWQSNLFENILTSRSSSNVVNVDYTSYHIKN